MRRLLSLLLLLSAILIFPALAHGQTPANVTAEAVGQANLRATTDVNATLLGQIVSGTRYPVVGRSQFFPWLLLGDPTSLAPIGWVFADLVNVSGSLDAVPFSSFSFDQSVPLPTAQPTPTAAPPISATAPASGSTAQPAQLLPSATPASSVYGIVTGSINLRYGPGVDYPRIGSAKQGETLAITAYHTQLPWVRVSYPAAPNGEGWVAIDLLEIQGDLYSLPTVSQTSFDLPTLTPTPQAMQISTWNTTPVAVSPSFQALGDNLWNMMLAAGFEVEPDHVGSLFLMNLNTGEAISYNANIAYSGMSLIKIAILASVYGKLDVPLNLEGAINAANMMVCSENSASNYMLGLVDDGDPLQGAANVTAWLKQLGLSNTYLIAPFKIDPAATPYPVQAPAITADQSQTNPDYANRTTVENLGWLLAGMYQCAYQGGGPLMSAAPNAYTPGECRQMLDLMSLNNMGQPLMMAAGVPAGTHVAHKHGYIDDTHGNAGIVFTPGGDFVLVASLYIPTWLDYSISFPLFAQMSQATYNYFNPTAPVTEFQENAVAGFDQCKVSTLPIITELTSLDLAG